MPPILGLPIKAYYLIPGIQLHSFQMDKGQQNKANTTGGSPDMLS